MKYYAFILCFTILLIPWATSDTLIAPALSIGSGDGSLSVAGLYTHGYIAGDDATFDPTTGGSGTTIWNGVFYLYDITNSAPYYFDKSGFTNHQNANEQPVDGTTSNDATSMTNTGMTFPASSDLSADLSFVLSQPSGTAVATWNWTFYNAGASPLEIRFVMFVDADINAPSSGYADELVGVTASPTTAGGRALVQSNDSSGSPQMNEALLLDADVAPAKWFGLSNGSGPSYWWSNTPPYNGIGVEVALGIDDSVANTIENDADNSKLSDSATDCGMAMQWYFSIPASGNVSVSPTITWGPGGTFQPLCVDNWEAY